MNKTKEDIGILDFVIIVLLLICIVILFFEVDRLNTEVNELRKELVFKENR